MPGFSSAELRQLFDVASRLESADGDDLLRVAVKACLSADATVGKILASLLEGGEPVKTYPLKKLFRALSRVGQFDAVAALVGHPSTDVRLAAVHAFYNYGVLSDASHFEPLLRDKDPGVRARAHEAVEVIESPDHRPRAREAVTAPMSDEELLTARIVLRRLDNADAAPVARLLGSESRVMRALARRALAAVSRSDGVLVETLEGMSASGRALSREAIGALQDLADRRAVELLVLTLRQADPGTRGAAADALSALGSHAAAPLLEAFEHDPEVRRRCGGLVARVAGPAALPALLRTFQSPFESERRSAADGLAQLGASALPPLRARLPHTDPDHRALILGILGRSGSPETLDAILVGAGDTDPSVRVAAIQALTAFDTPKATGALSAAARSPNWRIRRAAVAALGHRGWQNHEAARMLGNAIRDVNPHVRTAAAEALGRLASGFTLTDIEPFVEALRHGDEVARTRARATLEALRGALAFNIAVPRLNSPEGAAMALGIERELRAHVDLAEYDMVVSEFRQVVPDLPARDVEVGRQHQQSAQGSITDAVRFSVLSPFTTMRGRPCLIDVWAHTGDLDAVLRDMRHHPAWRPGVNVRSKGPMDVSRGTTLSARIAVPTLGWADDDTVTWGGAAGNATYAFVVPADATHGEHAGHLHVHVGGIQLARVTFLITVGDTDADAQDVTVSQRIVHSAFASYASEDRDRVLARIQGMQQVARDLDIFVDVVSLRSGERWEERLESEILDRDVLYLFWSRAASASPWVDREWRTAYRAKGLDGIEPVPIEPPDVSPPPLELSSLHFNDWTLEVRRRADT